MATPNGQNAGVDDTVSKVSNPAAANGGEDRGGERDLGIGLSGSDAASAGDLSVQPTRTGRAAGGVPLSPGAAAGGGREDKEKGSSASDPSDTWKEYDSEDDRPVNTMQFLGYDRRICDPSDSRFNAAAYDRAFFI